MATLLFATMHPPFLAYYLPTLQHSDKDVDPSSASGGGISAVLTQNIDIRKLAPAANQRRSHRPVALISGQPRLPARCPNLWRCR